MHLFFFTLPPPLKVSSASLLCKTVKLYPVLYDKKMKGYKEKDAVSYAAWNGVAGVGGQKT